MQLLVSVSDPAEAAAALVGGAALIDAKDPYAGPLGAVTIATFRAIVDGVGGLRPVTAALGDASDPAPLEDAARAFADAGAALVKVGFAGVEDDRVASLLAAAMRGAGGSGDPNRRSRTGVIAVAYADAPCANAPGIAAMLQIAAAAGVHGLLIDTFDKQGPGLRALVPHDLLMGYVEAAHRTRLLVALAGRLRDDDLPGVAATGADIAGVRGAACGGDRAGRVSAAQVRMLCARCGLAGR